MSRYIELAQRLDMPLLREDEEQQQRDIVQQQLIVEHATEAADRAEDAKPIGSL